MYNDNTYNIPKDMVYSRLPALPTVNKLFQKRPYFIWNSQQLWTQIHTPLQYTCTPQTCDTSINVHQYIHVHVHVYTVKVLPVTTEQVSQPATPHYIAVHCGSGQSSKLTPAHLRDPKPSFHIHIKWGASSEESLTSCVFQLTNENQLTSDVNLEHELYAQSMNINTYMTVHVYMYTCIVYNTCTFTIQYICTTIIHQTHVQCTCIYMCLFTY